jgi:hypothetical protein
MYSRLRGSQAPPHFQCCPHVTEARFKVASAPSRGARAHKGHVSQDTCPSSRPTDLCLWNASPDCCGATCGLCCCSGQHAGCGGGGGRPWPRACVLGVPHPQLVSPRGLTAMGSLGAVSSPEEGGLQPEAPAQVPHLQDLTRERPQLSPMAAPTALLTKDLWQVTGHLESQLPAHPGVRLQGGSCRGGSPSPHLSGQEQQAPLSWSVPEMCEAPLSLHAPLPLSRRT